MWTQGSSVSTTITRPSLATLICHGFSSIPSPNKLSVTVIFLQWCWDFQCQYILYHWLRVLCNRILPSDETCRKDQRFEQIFKPTRISLSLASLKQSEKDVVFYVSGYVPNIWSWIYVNGRVTWIPDKHSAAVKHFTFPHVFPSMNSPVEFVTILTWYVRLCSSSFSWPNNHGATQQCSVPCLHGTLLTLLSEHLYVSQSFLGFADSSWLSSPQVSHSFSEQKTAYPVPATELRLFKHFIEQFDSIFKEADTCQ